MQTIDQKRIDAIDVAKGIGIILVVFAHIILTEPLVTIIYSFHIPLFFVLSGMTMKVNKYKTFKEIFTDKFKKMIVPYLIFCAFGILTLTSTNLFRSIRDQSAWEGAASFFSKAIYSVVWAPYSLKYFTVFNTPMWFVPCLVLTEFTYYAICRLFKNKTGRVAVASLVLTVFGWVTEAEIIPFDFSVLPFNFSSACFSIGFFALGNISFPYFKKTFDVGVNRHSALKYLFVLIASACIMVFAGMMNGQVSIGSRILGNGFLLYISGVFGTLFILALSKIAERSKILKYCGRNSFTIMGCHMVIYIYVSIMWKLAEKFSPVMKMRNPITDFVLTLLLSLAFTVVYNYLKLKLRNKSLKIKET